MRLGIPIQRLQRETTSEEFEEWRVFLREYENKPQPIHFYLAQIAAEIRRSWVKDKKKVSIKEFLLDFTPKVRETFVAPKTEKEKKAHIAKSKAAWMAFTNFEAYQDPKKQKKEKPRLRQPKPKNPK